jgi:hypothetical protein
MLRGTNIVIMRGKYKEIDSTYDGRELELPNLFLLEANSLGRKDW